VAGHGHRDHFQRRYGLLTILLERFPLLVGSIEQPVRALPPPLGLLRLPVLLWPLLELLRLGAPLRPLLVALPLEVLLQLPLLLLLLLLLGGLPLEVPRQVLRLLSHQRSVRLYLLLLLLPVQLGGGRLLPLLRRVLPLLQRGRSVLPRGIYRELESRHRTGDRLRHRRLGRMHRRILELVA
jgi:hypothetical protein